MKRILLAGLVAIALAVLGCGTKDKTVAPKAFLDLEQAKQFGDPDADEILKGDPDATGDQAAPIYQPPNKGDPTADDSKVGDPTDTDAADADGVVVH